MVVVSDTSIITGLLAIDKISLLLNLFGEVLISDSVYAELQTLKSFGYNVSSLNKDWISKYSIQDNKKLELLLKRLDIGESESIILALEQNADYLLIDEKKGRKIAKELGIKIIGLLGILIQAKKTGLITSLKSELDKLTSKLEFRIREELIDRALKEVNEK